MTYIIKSGDTLSQIAERLLGDANRYRDIAQLNGISNPNLIMVGQELKIPTDASPSREVSSSPQLSIPFKYQPQILYLTGDYGEMRGSVQHRALDFALPAGVPLLSVCAGTVFRVLHSPPPGVPRNQVGGGFGRFVTIHDPKMDLYWTYAHMSEVSAALYPGASVLSGQEIGKSGGAQEDPGAGYTFGPHLHLQAGKPYTNLVDPWPLLKKQLFSRHSLKSNDQGIVRRLGL